MQLVSARTSSACTFLEKRWLQIKNVDFKYLISISDSMHVGLILSFNVCIAQLKTNIKNSAAFYVPSLSSFENLSLFGDHSISYSVKTSFFAE